MIIVIKHDYRLLVLSAETRNTISLNQRDQEYDIIEPERPGIRYHWTREQSGSTKLC